ncbi:hypothetical protein ACFFSW_17850 [Saccharothrix longispora]|uniref:Uncharacterized protein n=1 Tax=Saccharothrix longispora TaxID=33920 RepID=A0ABU1PTV8_9PSEU|nr:hypothetical protein [Saccharothrix longispora]MDR6593559.1 hypothetical protein [Saccharothrix longispora]
MPPEVFHRPVRDDVDEPLAVRVVDQALAFLGGCARGTGPGAPRL